VGLIYLLATGLILLVYLDEKRHLDSNELWVLQVAVSFLTFSGFLLLYSYVRMHADDKRIPSTLLWVITFYVLLPLMSDLDNLFVLESQKRNLVARAESLPQESFYQITAINLNVRSGPSVQNEKISVINLGDNVTAYEHTEGWIRIGDHQWISDKFIVKKGGLPLINNKSIKFTGNGKVLNTTLTLSLSDRAKGVVLGRYRYEGHRDWLILKGSINYDRIELIEFDQNGKETGQWILSGTCVDSLGKAARISTGCSLTGTWKNMSGETSYKISSDSY
jgi:hypothetical protein